MTAPSVGRHPGGARFEAGDNNRLELTSALGTALQTGRTRNSTARYVYLSEGDMLTGLNHITLAVRDLGESLAFYVSLLGFTPHVQWTRGAYLTLGDLWLCLSVDESRPSEDYSHIAFSIAAGNFGAFVSRIEDAGVIQWKTNRSEGDSLYILDPDGHKLEIHVGNLNTRLQHLREKTCEGLEWLQET